MRKLFFLFTVSTFIVLIIYSCSSAPRRSRKPVSSVEISPTQKNYKLGQPLKFTVNTQLKDGSLKQVQLFLNNKLLITSDKESFVFELPALTDLGTNAIRVVAEKTDGVSNIRLHNFTVLSDVLPQKLSYKVVKEYPHSTQHFTQGLEIHNDFLYEGTGENGKSAIFKIQLPTGKILQSKEIDNQYFGEGITILNDKLYQLTYQNKVAFVYNLSDFALIDSFKFSSKEGWGLTNDGKSLIMSNGTNQLIWINPESYAIEKTMLVADNKNEIQFINELEYIDGTIWANIWMTNRIVQIDAESGKVLAFAYLDGILNIMDKHRADRIDVLNGIAVLPKTGNLLVTGKLWPKMFELKLTPAQN